jgi:hypothetical protein
MGKFIETGRSEITRGWEREDEKLFFLFSFFLQYWGLNSGPIP